MFSRQKVSNQTLTFISFLFPLLPSLSPLRRERKTSSFGQRCVSSGHYGTSRDILGHFGTFWDILGQFGKLYDEFGAFGLFSLSFTTIFTQNRLNKKNAFRTDRRTDGPTDRRTDGTTDRRTHRRTDHLLEMRGRI